MKIDKLLSRCDEETIQKLIGKDAFRFIQLLNKQDNVLTQVKDVLIELYSFEGLLIDNERRHELFDLLRPNEAEDILQKLEGRKITKDLYARLKKKSFRRGSVDEKVLFNYFETEVPPVDNVALLPNVEDVEGTYTLFPHQRRASSEILKHLNKGSARVLLHMPTGSGKTRTAMHVIADFLMQRENHVVVWLAYSEELCEQAFSEFKQAWKILGNRELKAYRFWKNYKLNFENVSDGLIVAGLSKTFNASKKEIKFMKTLASKCALIIIDEAHQAIAESYKLILDALFSYNSQTSLLGLTATPGRTTAEVDQDRKLAEFFDRNKVTLQVEGYKSPIDYLIKEGYLANANYETLNYEHGEDFDVDEIMSSFDIPKKILDKLAKDELRNLKILSVIETLIKRHKRMLVFAINVEHSQMLAAVLRARGHNAFSVTSSTPQEERKRIIEGYKIDDGEHKILCNYGVLTTGFDAPKTSAAVIARPTKSLVLFSQMVGRVIRGPKAGGNKEATVATVVDLNLPGFGNLVESFNNWEDVWS